MKHKQTRRLFALLLVFALVIGLLPSVLADNEPSTAESAEETLVDSQPEVSPAIAPPTQSILESDEAVESPETETDDKAETPTSMDGETLTRTDNDGLMLLGGGGTMGKSTCVTFAAYQSPLDILFQQLSAREPGHIAVKYYLNYRSGAAKTLKSIQITLMARLEKFNLQSLASLTMTDELDLPSLGEKKVALFAQIPDNDSSFNFIVSMLYTQLFQQLFSLADRKYNGALPVHVHFLMDEFANVSLPDDFEKILSVMRSREVSASIILQNLAQLKSLFEKQWESVVGNCDSFLFLGGNEQQTHKYVSELLGKETIESSSHGKTKGRSGSYSTNYQQTGRELLTPDEVRMLDNQYALLFLRGERPVMDKKYNILRHPNIKLSTDGSGEPYLHGTVHGDTASVCLTAMQEIKQEQSPAAKENTTYELLSSDELEAQIFKEETK